MIAKTALIRALLVVEMRKRSSRAGDFYAKVCGHLDRAEAAERKREFAARKAIA